MKLETINNIFLEIQTEMAFVSKYGLKCIKYVLFCLIVLNFYPIERSISLIIGHDKFISLTKIRAQFFLSGNCHPKLWLEKMYEKETKYTFHRLY